MKKSEQESESGTLIQVSIADQSLLLYVGGECVRSYSVSTSMYGIGSESGSEKTPLGWHTVRAKVGDGLALNSVFVGRRFTGEIYNDGLAAQYPQRDWILTRILWLSGMEVGLNRLGSVDSMRRYIYLHGTPDTEPMGEARSHGCIRMRNSDIVDLFDRVDIKTCVVIGEQRRDYDTLLQDKKRKLTCD